MTETSTVPGQKGKTMSFKKRYILAQEAEERIVSLYRKECGASADIFNTAIDACQSIVLDMYDNSSADVVEIVRCLNCKHHDGVRCFRWNSVIVTRFEDFCSSGERKDDDT